MKALQLTKISGLGMNNLPIGYMSIFIDKFLHLPYALITKLNSI